MSQQTTAPARASSATDFERRPQDFGNWFRRFISNLPTALVLAALAAVAFYGHRHDWKMPKMSEIGDSGVTNDSLAWCPEHGVPEAKCIECRPELLPKPKDFGWCRVHGVPQCAFCNSEVAQLKEASTLKDADLERAERAFALRPRAENNSKCTLYRRRLQFASLDAIKKAGLDVDLIARDKIDETVTAAGEITYDQTRVAHLPAKSAGTVFRVDKKIGDRVSAGEILAVIDAVDVGRTKTEFLEAFAKWEFAVATKERLLPLSEKGAVAGSRMLEVETACREAWSRVLRAQQALVNLGLPIAAEDFKGKTADEITRELQLLGFPERAAANLDQNSITSNLLPVRAPFDATIVDSDVVPGEFVETSNPLFTLADTRTMWLTLDVPAEEADYVAVGQTVRFQTSSKQTSVSGQVEWISTESDPQTRTVKVRAILENANGKLRNETFGTGKIVLRSETEAIVVPSDSLQWDGSCQVVFVRDKNFFDEKSPKFFYPRPVRVGARTSDKIEILAGVLPGEVVVTKGSGVLRGELLKNNLGAG